MGCRNSSAQCKTVTKIYFKKERFKSNNLTRDTGNQKKEEQINPKQRERSNKEYGEDKYRIETREKNQQKQS